MHTTIKDLYDKYFKDKPAEDDIRKATYAYHKDYRDYRTGEHEFRLPKFDIKTNPTADMSEEFKNDTCRHCGRSRSDVRWDDLPAHCHGQARAGLAAGRISEVIHAEEKLFYEALRKGEQKIPEILNRHFNGELSAKALFLLETSHGYHHEVVSAILGADLRGYMEEFDRLLAEHRLKSGKFKIKSTDK